MVWLRNTYGIEVCPANKSDTRCLQYVVDNCFRKIFDIKLKETVEECMREFNVLTVNDVIDARKRKFLAKYSVSENSLCQVFARVTVWVTCDNCTRYVMPFVLYCYLVTFFPFLFSLSVSVLQFGEIKLCVYNTDLLHNI